MSKREFPLNDGAIPLSNETSLKLAPSEARRLWQALTLQGNIKAYLLIPAEDGSGTLGAYVARVDTMPLTGARECMENLKKQAIDVAEGGICRPKTSRCYLTTVCCSVAGLNDDCFELRVLRTFRDTWHQRQTAGQRDIDAVYRFAPALSQRLEASPDRRKIVRVTYIRDTVPSVLMIRLGMPVQAWRHYRRLVAYMERVLVEPQDWPAVRTTPVGS